ncbi:hypothetical protein F0562_015858 [Nyssa sinensis]|uniref:Uncharacterized protein n=1 Tax=Nyssa sinensis TaxID=561372 RepID=A0A5J4ZJP0_9ASTE|nr:hypothetical protein F0562_015858 [Nyssa sinensis]
MKASLKFREDQNPLFRAKVPLNILGFPFQSGIVAGESKELSLNLSTLFDSGPSLKVAYRPNDSLNPFNLIFKTGIGHFGSPISSSMTMSAEFNLIGNQNPTFLVHFKPQFGDFTIKKSKSSDLVKCIQPKSNGVVSDDGTSVEVVETPVVKSGYFRANGFFSGKKISGLPSESPVASLIGGLLNGVEVGARTVLPMRQHAVLKFQWGVRLPAADEGPAVMGTRSTAGVSFQKLPLLVMNKIGIEHVAEDESNDRNKVGPSLNSTGNANVAEACFNVKHQLELIQADNGLLRKALDDLRSEIASAAGKSEGERGGGGVKPLGGKVDRRSKGDKKSSEQNGFGGKTVEADANEELKKALMGATVESEASSLMGPIMRPVKSLS